MARLDRRVAFLLSLVCSPFLLVNAGIEDDITPYRYLATPPEELHAQGRELLQESRELALGQQITCGNGTVARWIRTRCNSDSTEYFMYRNSACSGDPMTISEGSAQLSALYQCEKAEDSKFGLRYAGYGGYMYGACVDGQVVLEVHGEAGCHDDIASYVYPSQDCDALCVPAPPIGLGINTPCFTGKGEDPIPNCTCALECASCGYSEDPTDANDCIICKDGLILYNNIGSDVGYCSPPDLTKCFSEPGGTALAGCKCHPTCSACGYSATPMQPHSCIACATGLEFHPFFPDGTGYCLDAAAPSKCWEDYRGGILNKDCQCDGSCWECGFDVMPTSPDQCFGCKPPLGQAVRDPVTGLGACTLSGLCYESAGTDPIEGCECHPDCFSCGYGEDPTDMNQCIICSAWTYGAMQLNTSELNFDGTGPCTKPILCFATAEERYARKPIPDCACHPDCQACGYADEPTVSGYDHCIACVDGLYMNDITAGEGVGFCTATPCIMFCMGSGLNVHLGPYGMPALVVMGVVFVATAMVATKLRKRYKGDEIASAVEGKVMTATTYGSTSNSASEGQPLMSAYNAEEQRL